MKILIAPNAFKGSLSASEVAQTIKTTILDKRDDLQCYCLPIADGGDGTFEVLKSHFEGQEYLISTRDLIDREIEAPLFISEDRTAIIELSSVAGLRLLSPSEYSPLTTHTFGVGELIREALDLNCKKIILAIGGSGTLDMGVGALRALGVKFYDKKEREVHGGGGQLSEIVRVDLSYLDKRLWNIDFQIACDVENPLIGESGAAHVFGGQKGASTEEIILLEKNHRCFAQLIKKQNKVDVSLMKYGGAAGGIAASLHAFCSAKLRPGSELILDYIGFDKILNQCDLLITGEGRIDSQSNYGKAPFVAALKAKNQGIKVIAFCGCAEELKESPFDDVIPIKKDEQTIEEAMKFAKSNLTEAVEAYLKLL